MRTGRRVSADCSAPTCGAWQAERAERRVGCLSRDNSKHLMGDINLTRNTLSILNWGSRSCWDSWVLNSSAWRMLGGWCRGWWDTRSCSGLHTPASAGSSRGCQQSLFSSLRISLLLWARLPSYVGGKLRDSQRQTQTLAAQPPESPLLPSPPSWRRSRFWRSWGDSWVWLYVGGREAAAALTERPRGDITTHSLTVRWSDKHPDLLHFLVMKNWD